MLIPGLVSVTFRQLNQNEIGTLMQKADLKAIEWGGDVHIPIGSDEETVENSFNNAFCLSERGHFYIASFGSYYRCEGYPEATIYAAEALNAPNIRVWAGTRPSANADARYRKLVVESIQELCDNVASKGMTVSTEFHGGTLTDDVDSALKLISDVERNNFCTYWQPNQYRDEEYNIKSLNAVLPYVSNVHVFAWDAANRYPLSDGEKSWRKYIDILSKSGNTHHMLLEFVKDDSIEQFYEDAETLKNWLR